MKCIECGKAEMVHDIRDIAYTYKGQTTTIPRVIGEYCPVCDESLHDAHESERLSAAMLEFNKDVNGSLVDPAFIVNIRKKLKLDQQEAAEIFGGGPNAFSRYENGKTKPSFALMQLLRILDNHPSLIDEIRPARSSNESQVLRAKTKPLVRRRKRVSS